MLKFSIVNAWVIYLFLLRKRGEFRKAMRYTLNDFMHDLVCELVVPYKTQKRAREEEIEEARKKARREKKTKWQAAARAKQRGERGRQGFAVFKKSHQSLLENYLKKLAQ